MHDSKFFFDNCKDDYDGAMRMRPNRLEFWSDDDGRNLLVKKILDNMSWDAYDLSLETGVVAHLIICRNRTFNTGVTTLGTRLRRR